jgi:hypothetical protein
MIPKSGILVLPVGRFGHTGGMARTLDALDNSLMAWIAKQPVFFVATAPSGRDGHVNLSPKGYDSFRVLGPTQVAYLDLTGSGVETVAHIRDNGRLTVMFCAFSGPPRILRLYGSGEVVVPDDDRFGELVRRFPRLPGVRSVIMLSIERISTSCGFAVPNMELTGERSNLLEFAERGESAGTLAAYRAKENAFSIDGLPGLAG